MDLVLSNHLYILAGIRKRLRGNNAAFSTCACITKINGSSRVASVAAFARKFDIFGQCFIICSPQDARARVGGELYFLIFIELCISIKIK